MSNEFKDWLIDATDEEILTVYQRCIDNGWFREASCYEKALNERGSK